MVTIGKPGILTVVKEYLLMTFGMCCYAFGWIGWIMPAKSLSASGKQPLNSTCIARFIQTSFGKASSFPMP